MAVVDQDLRALDGMQGEPITVMLAGQPYTMGMLEWADYVNCAADRAKDRLKVIFDTDPTNLARDVSDIKSKMGAEVLTKPCSPWDLLGDCEGLCRLAAKALNRGGHPAINFAGLMNQPTQFPFKDLEQAVFRASGFHIVKAAPKDAVSGNPPQTATSM